MTHELSIGQVQWHSSEEDGGPDVGILLRLSETHHLWLGETLDSELDDPCGVVIYGPHGEKTVFALNYDELRQVFEEYVSPALAQGMSAGTAKTPEAAEGEVRQPGAEGMRP